MQLQAINGMPLQVELGRVHTGFWKLVQVSSHAPLEVRMAGTAWDPLLECLHLLLDKCLLK